MSFLPRRTGFKIRLNKGIVKIQDVYEDHNLMSFSELMAKFDLPQKHFFKYLQLRSFNLAQSNNSVQQPSFSILETHYKKRYKKLLR